MNLSKRATNQLLMFAIGLLAIAASAVTQAIELPSDTDPAIKECVDKMAPESSLTHYVSLVSYDDSGIIDESAGNLFWIRDEDGQSKAIIRLSAPASRAGLAVLMHEQAEKKPKLFLYVPDLKRTRTVTGKQVATSMMGTDFSYEEFSYLQNVAEDNTTVRADDQQLEGNNSYVFHTTPGDEEAVYTLIETFIDQSMCIPVLTRFHKNDVVAKELVVDRDSIQEVNDRQVPHKVTMHDRTKNTRTELVAKDVEIDAGLDDSMFHPKRLGSSF